MNFIFRCQTGKSEETGIGPGPGGEPWAGSGGGPGEPSVGPGRGPGAVPGGRPHAMDILNTESHYLMF